jgi:hypothetical protein
MVLARLARSAGFAGGDLETARAALEGLETGGGTQPDGPILLAAWSSRVLSTGVFDGGVGTHRLVAPRDDSAHRNDARGSWWEYPW